MSRGINKAILIGNLGGDPETRYLPNGNAVANITLATSDSWKDRETGQLQERTEWHRVVFFGKLAEIVGQYLRKGSKIYVEGACKPGSGRKTVSSDTQLKSWLICAARFRCLTHSSNADSRRSNSNISNNSRPSSGNSGQHNSSRHPLLAMMTSTLTSHLPARIAVGGHC